MKRFGLLILVSSLLGFLGVAHADDVGVGQITEPAVDNPNQPREPSPGPGDQFLTERASKPAETQSSNP